MSTKTMLRLGEHVPAESERATVGANRTPVYVVNLNADIVFKNEEGNDTDRIMTPRLRACCDRLAALVIQEWPDTRLRITEAFDTNREHGENSLHYQARATDMTTSPPDPGKLGRLAGLALEAGFDWVFYENKLHVHGSVKATGLLA